VHHLYRTHSVFEKLQAMNPTTTQQQKRDAARLALERLATKRAPAEAAAPEAAPEAAAPEAALTFPKEEWAGLFGEIFGATKVTFIGYRTRAQPRLPFPLPRQPPEPTPPTQAELEDRLAESMAYFLASYEGYEGVPDRWARALGKGNRPPLAEAAKTELSPKERARKALERLAAAAPAS
jgi:hypothetical protein